MDIGQALKDSENALRDFLEYSLERNFGTEWLEKCGIPAAKIEVWHERKANAESDYPPNSGEERILFYAPFEDLYDLVTLNWVGDFQAAFTDRDQLMTYMKLMEKYRHTDLQRRELFVYQKHLILGITGEIRSKITAFRSLMEIGKEG